MAIKADCGNTCSEELNTMLAIAMLVLLIALKSLFFLSFDNAWGISLYGEKIYSNISAHRDTWHWLSDFPHLASLPCFHI